MSDAPFFATSTIQLVSELPVLAARPADSNKGTFGRVLVVAGSRGMSGAAVLCAGAALRGGAGLVRLAAPAEILPIVAVANPCYLTTSLPGDDQGLLSIEALAQLHSLSQSSDVVALGPGLGRSQALTTLVCEVIRRVGVPLVLDADGLNALQGSVSILGESKAGLILTPHPGEFARLLGCETESVQANREELAVRFAHEHKIVLVLKGHRTVVSDGQRVFRNRTGNPGMATGGTGDVLTGLIAALVAQGLRPFQAAQLGVCLHGLAGDLARDDLGEVSMIASDVLDYLPRAFRRIPQFAS